MDPAPRTGPVVDLDGRSLRIAGIADVAHRRAAAALSDTGRERAARSNLFAAQVQRERPLYGRTTGVGANRTVQLTGDPDDNALNLLRSHATSAGAPRSAPRIRAMLAVRLNQLAAGGSGVHPLVLDELAGMLASDDLPDVRELGSIGTGDLAALATTALALMGEGRTSSRPRRLRFGASDGLAFLSSNAAALGDAALAISSLAEAAEAAMVVAALTFCAVDGNAEAYSDGALVATPFDGARAVGLTMRKLTGTDRYGVSDGPSGTRPPARIQDPYGLRAMPQVHGAVLDHLSAAAAVIETLVNAPTENPVLLPNDPEPDGGLVAHHAGFHAVYLQLAIDGVNLAVAQSCQLVLGRLAMLVDPSATGLPPFLGDGTPAASGMLMCEYVAASAVGAIRAAAHPAGLQGVSLSRGVEEDASFASLAALSCLAIAENYRQLVSCELIAAVRAVRMRPERTTSGSVEAILRVCSGLSADIADRDLTADLALGTEAIPQLALLAPRVARSEEN